MGVVTAVTDTLSRMVQSVGMEQAVPLSELVKLAQAALLRKESLMEWITDENGNKASVEFFGTREVAEKSLKTLTNCMYLVK